MTPDREEKVRVSAPPRPSCAAEPCSRDPVQSRSRRWPSDEKRRFVHTLRSVRQAGRASLRRWHARCRDRSPGLARPMLYLGGLGGSSTLILAPVSETKTTSSLAGWVWLMFSAGTWWAPGARPSPRLGGTCGRVRPDRLLYAALEHVRVEERIAVPMGDRACGGREVHDRRGERLARAIRERLFQEGRQLLGRWLRSRWLRNRGGNWVTRRSHAPLRERMRWPRPSNRRRESHRQSLPGS